MMVRDLIAKLQSMPSTHYVYFAGEFVTAAEDAELRCVVPDEDSLSGYVETDDIPNGVVIL